MTPGPLLTAKQLALQLGCSTGALLRWTRDGKVPALKLPSGAIRYRPEVIEAWLAEHEVGKSSEGVSEIHRPAIIEATRNSKESPGAE